MNYKSENKEISLAERIGLIIKNQAYPLSNKTVSRTELILMVKRAFELSGVKVSDKTTLQEIEAAADDILLKNTGRLSTDAAACFVLNVYKQQPFLIMDATIRQLQAALETGKITAVELVGLYHKRIEAFDRQGPKIRAMLALNPLAEEQAKELDNERKQYGSRGPLHGIPIVLKDNYNTKDMPTTGGALVLASFFPQEDSFLVKNLRKAGAIILGKTNLHEMALFGLTKSALGGQTLNPYDLTRTPGGSSGGTGAAVSANFAAAGTGTDTVNSIRSPSSANNLVGIRPTKGLISLEGIIPVSFTQDNAGPLARTVVDAVIMLEAMVGNDVPYIEALNEHGLTGKKIGVLLNLFGREQIHEEVNRITELAAEEMKSLGAQMIDITIPDLDTDRLLRDLDVQRYEMMHELDSYFSFYNAPVKTLDEFIIKGGYDPSLEVMLNTVQSLDSPLEHADYMRRLDDIENLKRKIMNIMNDHQLDAFLYPHQKRLAVSVGEETQAERNGILGAVIGFPAITFQGGFSVPTETAPIGIPIGIELLAKPLNEELLINMAYSYEKSNNQRQLPPFTPPLDEDR